MSLAAESPHSSSSSDDFAALLDAELEAASSHSSFEEDAVNNDDDEEEFEEQRTKRHKVGQLSAKEELQGSVINGTILEQIGKPSKVVEESICPPHPGFFKGLCMRCGQLEEDDGSGVAFGYIHKDLKLGSKEIDRLRGVDLKNLLRDRKLILILDLDHTLINSAKLVEVENEEKYLLQEADLIRDDPKRSLFKLERMFMMTKLRPFVRTFLQEASSLFELYVYTMAERPYALEIVRLLDPENIYFDGRVITQADCTQQHQKGLDVVLGSENMVVILDDTEFVWRNHKDNLILMGRYHYFAASCRQFNLNFKSLSLLKEDENESDGTLASILNVLKRAHEMYFDEALDTDLSSRDVRKILRKISQEVLQGCKIVFSRVYRCQARAEDEPIWRKAQQLGAVCSTEVDLSVTHVVSTDRGTEKSRWALQNEKFLVNPNWVEAAFYLWRRPREGDYTVVSQFKEPRPKQKSVHCDGFPD